MKAILKWSQNLKISPGKKRANGYLLLADTQSGFFSGINNKKFSTYLKNYNYFGNNPGSK